MILSRRRSASAAFAVVDEGSATWERAALLSPVAVPGSAVVRARGERLEKISRREVARPADRFRQVDMRRRQLVLSPQSIPAAEGIDVHVTAVVTVRVGDPVAFAAAAEDPDAEVYLAVQIALRDAVAAVPLDDVLQRRVDLDGVRRAASLAAAGVGLELVAVVLKDASAPRQVALAREEEQVVQITSRTAMERARAEVKATRARLAAAQMLERSPILAGVRLLEALPAGATLKVDAGTLPGLSGTVSGTGTSDDA
ncbi:SPFH domain-containing protein [Brachybacterium sp. ACRRE]|uniref:SPFH domain-containing protein n=1 Tax=Brachybacterium sp. ACRRE TaxID=2918184 RepID=UPI001EF17F5B|nr:SPFH domain-containing protein [Brachybacterium sp. ACRRE]MCG7309773.1 hypothetical protein [Brachybacterium sp. ACRRE]